MPNRGRLIFPDINLLKAEIVCPCCGRLPPGIYTDPYYKEFYSHWQIIRVEWGRPIIISRGGGGWRCARFQYQLIIDGKTKATLNPHSFGALDNDLDSEKEILEFVELVESKFPDMRIGYQSYLDQGKTFVHLDEVYKIKPKPSISWIAGFRF